ATKRSRTLGECACVQGGWRCGGFPASTRGSDTLLAGLTPRRRFAPHRFWGRRDGVGVNAYRRHHGEGKHDERDVTPPAMPGARLVVIESEFVLGGFKAVLDRPTMTLDFRKLFEGRSVWRPGREEGEVAVGDFTTDQKSARPCLAFERLAVLTGVEIGEFKIGPVVSALALRPRARRKP